MSQVCPQCSKDVPDSFGLTTCQYCGFTFFPGLAAGTADAVMDDSTEGLDAEESEHSTSDEPVDLFSMTKKDEEYDSQLGNESTAQPSAIDAEPMSAESFQNEIQKFASEQTAAVFLTYRFFIHGIDTVQIRHSVLEVLSEPRLGLDLNKLPSQIRQGELVLDKLNAAQASYIARHLGAISVEMQWIQESL